MASLDKVETEQTPLQEKLDIIAVDIGKLGMYCAILIVHVLLARFFIEGMIRREFDLFGGEMDTILTKDQCRSDVNGDPI